MKRVLSVAILMMVLAVAATWVGLAAAGSASFTGNYKGTVTEKVNGQAVSATPHGTGTGTVIGKSTLTGLVAGNTANPPCSPLSGPGTLKGAKGTIKLTLKPGSRACAASADDQNNISFNGSATVKGGTGKFKKAKGLLRYAGHYDRAKGTFTVRLLGNLTY